MTELQLLELTKTFFREQLSTLKGVESFYQYEKDFEAMWLAYGRQVFEQSIGEVSEDRRKKKSREPIWSNRNCKNPSLE